MANADIKLLFGVSRGAPAGDSLKEIRTGLTQIMTELNKTPLKVKVSLDTEKGGQRSWSSQLQTKLNAISASNKFSIMVSKINISAGAISDFNSRLSAIINTLSIGKGVSVTLSSKSMGNITGELQNASDAAAKFTTQMDMLDKKKKSLLNAVSSMSTNGKTAEEKAQIAAVVSQYEKWSVEIEKLRTSKTAASEKHKTELYEEAAAIQANIDNLIKLGVVGTQSTTSLKNNFATVKEVASAYQKLNTYINKNPRAAGMSQFDQIISMRDQLRGLLNSGSEINGVFTSLDKQSLRNIIGSFTKLDAEIAEAGKKGNTLFGIISAAYKRFGGWTLVTRSLTLVIRGLKDMVKCVREIDTAMTELKKVTNESDAAYEKFLTNASTRAQKLGASLVDTISASADFARLGYNISQSEKLADAALVYKNVGDGIEMEDATQSLIATLQAYSNEISPDEIMSIVDKFNEVGNNYAISSKGIGEALLRSAAAMNSANNSLDETIALATAANTVVQDPDKVGTTLKTVSMYLRAAKTDAEAAGEATDGMANSISELRSEILSLTGGKVDIQSDDNTFKSTYQILNELSSVWGELTDVSQANILELVGGKRNSNVVAALLENFTVAEESLKTSANSAGSALEENDKFLESIEGKLVSLKGAWQDLSQSFIKSDFVKFVIESATWIVDKLDGLIDALGSLGTIGLGAGIFAGIKNFGRPKTFGLKTIVLKLPNIISVLSDTEVFLWSVTRIRHGKCSITPEWAYSL